MRHSTSPLHMHGTRAPTTVHVFLCNARAQREVHSYDIVLRYASGNPASLQPTWWCLQCADILYWWVLNSCFFSDWRWCMGSAWYATSMHLHIACGRVTTLCHMRRMLSWVFPHSTTHAHTLAPPYAGALQPLSMP